MLTKHCFTQVKYAYIGRKLRKRDFRKLWVTRPLRHQRNRHGFELFTIYQPTEKADIQLNRKCFLKSLSEILKRLKDC